MFWLTYHTDTSGVYSQPNTIHTATTVSLHHAEITNLVVVLTEVWKHCFFWYLYWQFAIKVLLLHLSAWLEWGQGVPEYKMLFRNISCKHVQSYNKSAATSLLPFVWYFQPFPPMWGKQAPNDFHKTTKKVTYSIQSKGTLIIFTD